MKISWVKGNAKLRKLSTVGFGIPAYQSADGFKTCPQAGVCAAICYARQGAYVWPATVKAREHNLELVRGDLAEFVTQAVSDLSRMKAKTVRVHDSGDFFSQAYLDSWYSIARQTPGKVFYAYTKSLHLDLWTNKPENFQIVQSVGGRLDASIDDSRSHSRIFADHRLRKAAGYVDGNVNDAHAIKGSPRIGLVYHGTRNLTPAQSSFFV